MDNRELRERVYRAAARIDVPDGALPAKAHRSDRGAGALVAAALVLAVVAASQLTGFRSGDVAASRPATTPAFSSSAQAVASPSASPSPTPTAVLAPYESRALGYSVSLPAGLRRSDCLSGPGGAAPVIAGDVFTVLSPEQERASNLSDTARGGLPSAWTIAIALWSDAGLTPLDVVQRNGCARCEPNVPVGGRTETLSLNGYDAARLVIDNEPRMYAVQIGARMYVLDLFSYDGAPSRPAALPTGVVVQVAESLRASTAPVTPTPTPSPAAITDGARTTAQQLTAALKAGDVAALGALIVPRCWFDVEAGNAGPSGRAVAPYLAELRTRFGSGLTVQADPKLLVATNDGPGGSRIFLRSQWTSQGSTTTVDLYLREIDGRWYWSGAQFA